MVAEEEQGDVALFGSDRAVERIGVTIAFVFERGGDRTARRVVGENGDEKVHLGYSMNRMSDRATELERLIRYHQDKYYNDQPEIEDAEFDALWDELKRLDPGNAVLQEVGADGSIRFSKREHLMPMGSLEKASDPESFRAWARKIGHERYIVQYKLDGASLELQYIDGELLYGVTRGDGRIGDDITANVKRMRGAVATVEASFSGSVRGEVIMEHEVHRRWYSDKANCRNAANGLMRRKDGVGAEHLRILCYDAVGAEEEVFADEPAKLSWIASQGFGVVPFRLFEEVEEVITYRDLVQEQRGELDYDIDGLVVKGPAIDPDDMARARPQKQIAFKFSPEEEASVVLDVEWGSSGAIFTPVAILEPVRIAGTTVRRASLVHPEMIEELGLAIGSEVIVSKRGDIIPKVERLIRNGRGVKPIEIPTRCDRCDTALINEGKRLYCPNLECPRRLYHRLRRWLNVLDVRDFGDVLLGKLFDDGRVREIADLYTLGTDEIAEYEGMGQVSAARALGNLNSVAEIPLARFVAGFDIPGIAELTIAKIVDAGIETLEALRSASVEQLAAAEGVAEKTAVTILEGLEETREQMDRLLDGGVVTIAAPTSSKGEGRLAGSSFCFTGSLSRFTRAKAEAIVRDAGGNVRTSVSTALDYLVTNDPDSGSSKAKKARDLGIPILSEDEFAAMVDSV